MPNSKLPKSPRILTTTVGSYPIPDWLAALPSEQAVIDATRVVFDIQRQAGIDLPTDGELYRFDVNHPDTNGMIEYFIRPMQGISSVVGRSITDEFSRHHPMGFRRKPAGVVTGALGEGSLNLLADCQRAGAVAGGLFKFTVTSPYMLARTLLDHHYRDFEKLTMALGDVLAAQMPGLPTSCIQVDEANIPGNPEAGPLAAAAMNGGALAAKLAGAGQGGTVLAVTFDKERTVKALLRIRPESRRSPTSRSSRLDSAPITVAPSSGLTVPSPMPSA